MLGDVFDLLRTNQLLRRHVAAGFVSFGINHEMRDFVHNRRKNLDLVLCTPSAAAHKRGGRSLVSMVDDYEIELSSPEAAALDACPLSTVPPSERS